MLYKVGTQKELSMLDLSVPESVIERLSECIDILDDAYGKNRDYLKKGGYVVIAENSNDVLLIKDLIDYENHLYEWLDEVSDYTIAMYLLGDDYAIVVAMPVNITPSIIYKRWEEIL